MKKQHVFVLILLWAALTTFAWFAPAKAVSDSERRPLAQKPAITEGEFPFSITYELDGESITIEDVYQERYLKNGRQALLHENDSEYLHKIGLTFQKYR